MTPRGRSDVLKTHPAIWELFRASDGERSMSYDGARVLCGRDDCEGFTDELECPKGCGVRIESNQAERDEQCMREMRERDAERRAWRARVKADREARALGQKERGSDG